MNALVPRRVLIPSVTVYALIVLLPCVYMLSGGALGAWRRIWLTSRQWTLLGNTVGLAVMAASAAVIAGTLLAFLVARTDMRGRAVVFYAAFAQLFLPPHLLAIAGQYLWGGRFAGLIPAAGVLAISYYPLAFLLALAGLSSVDPGQEEAALLVRRPVAVLRGLIASLIRPHILAAWVLVALLCAVEYGVPDLLRLNTYPVEIFAQFSAYYDQAAAAALCAPLLAVGILAVWLMLRVLGSRSFVPLNIARSAAGARVALGHWRWSTSAIICLAVGSLLVLPVSSFVANVAASKRTLLSMFLAAPIASSIALAAAAATAIVVVAFPLAYKAERARPAPGNKVFFLGLLPLAVPATVIGIGLVSLWNRDLGVPVYGSWAMPILACTARFSPFALVILAASMKQLPVEQEQAGLLVAGGWFRRMARLVVPQCRIGIAVAWIISFIFSFEELGASLLVMPPGAETLTLRLFNLLHYGAHDVVSFLALTMIAIGLLACALIVWFTGMTSRSQSWSA